jgi:hypothetical protein
MDKLGIPVTPDRRSHPDRRCLRHNESRHDPFILGIQNKGTLRSYEILADLLDFSILDENTPLVDDTFGDGVDGSASYQNNPRHFVWRGFFFGFFLDILDRAGRYQIRWKHQ